MATTTGNAQPEALAGRREGVRRRDFINIAAVATAGVGAAATLVPLISQMAPSKDVLAESTTELDISAIEPGMAVKAVFRKQPVFVRNLTNAGDPGRRGGSGRQPARSADARSSGPRKATATGWSRWACAPISAASRSAPPKARPRGEFGGYFCPCHGSHYDTAGRIRKGPAPANLEVPEYAFTSDTKIVIGQESA